MTMSTQCKWISFTVMSLAVILLLLLFYSLEKKSKCPEEEHLRYTMDGKCYKKNTRGPCDHSFVFWEYEPKSHHGTCMCPYMLTNRTILHHKGQCYYIFTQAFCPEGHWLNITKAGEPNCEMNNCMQHAMNAFEADQNSNDDGEVDMKSKDQFDQSMHGHRAEMDKSPIVVPIKGGRCAILNQHAEGCPEGSVVRFHSNYILPSCYNPPKRDNKRDNRKEIGFSAGAIGVGAYSSPCPLGSAKAITGACQPYFEFDFEEPSEKSDSDDQ